MSTKLSILPDFDCAVQLKNGTDRLPAFFILPGLGGTAEALVEVSSQIVTPTRIYSFQPKGFDGTVPPDTQVEQMAGRYLAELKRIQPNGPYHLCGHSFGGVVAFEMARSLHNAGADVAELILLDTPLHWSAWPRVYFLRTLWQRLQHHCSVIRTLPLRRMIDHTVRTSGALLSIIFTRLGVATTKVPVDAALPEPMKIVWDCQLLALSKYHPVFYNGKMVYCVAEISEWAKIDPAVLWRDRVKVLEVRVVSGGHRSMLDPPYVASLASTLTECLGRSLSIP